MSGLRVWFGSVAVAAAAVALTGFGQSAEAQLSYMSGQSIAPAYEGFEENEDGTYSLVFGYMNRNWEEELDIPIGPDNYFTFTSAGGLDDIELDAYDVSVADQGQPTHFLPRRNRFTFKVRVPADFGDRELVWTLSARGETRRAFASLSPDLLVDNMILASETGAYGGGFSDPENRSNVAPLVELGSDREIEARVGQTVTLRARVTDDGLPISQAERVRRVLAARRAAQAEQQASQPQAAQQQAATAAEPAEPPPDPRLRALQAWLRPPRRITVEKVVGLHFTWFVYRGENHAMFDPIQVKTWEDTRAYHNSPWSPGWRAPAVPEDGEWVVNVTFDEPGTYTLRGRADDGALFTDEVVTVRVTPPVS